jgi:PII-like signaling protein
MLPKEGKLLRIFVAESEKHQNTTLYEWIVQQAIEHKMAGATVIRGLQGFGGDHQMHTAKILRLSQNLPILIEIIDQSEKIETFIQIIDPAIKEGLVTLERVEVRICRMRD